MTMKSNQLILATTLFVAAYSMGAAAQEPHTHDDGAAHSHGDDTHMHDNAPETEEFFGDAAEQAGDPDGSGAAHQHGENGHGEDHSHGEESHSHDDESHSHGTGEEGHDHAHSHE